MQDFLVYIIVAAAAFYLGKMLWNAGTGKKSGCNSCGSNCASQKPAPPQPLLQIEVKSNSSRKL